ncbi:MAG: hypothetical protein K0M45_09100 [Candidatus Paracaedibacteraceae bacterium]|nr:hypothetical protein [Candidatus Paracaedibacteraceae bacterium]
MFKSKKIFLFIFIIIQFIEIGRSAEELQRENKPIMHRIVQLDKLFTGEKALDNIIERSRAGADIFYKETLPLRPSGRYQETIAAVTNIGRLAVHISYSDGSLVTIEDQIQNDKKKMFSKICYLSGNQTLQLTRRQPAISQDYGFASMCEVPESDPHIMVIQRTQPNPITMSSRLCRLAENTSEVLEGNSNSVHFIPETNRKKVSMEEVKKNADSIINLLKYNIHQEENNSNPINPFHSQGIALMKAVLSCLEKQDYGFITVPDKPSGLKALGADYIKTIRKNLYGELTDDILYNSKYFNLGCSEQFLLDSVFARKVNRIGLAERVIEATNKKEVDHIAIQIDTTKAPCEICVTDILLNTVKGDIKDFFDSLEIEKLEDYQKKVIITYTEPYDGDYSFSISSFSEYSSLFPQWSKGNSSVKVLIVPNHTSITWKAHHLRLKLEEVEKGMQLMGIDATLPPSFKEVISHICSLYQEHKNPSQMEAILIEYCQDRDFVNFLVESVPLGDEKEEQKKAKREKKEIKDLTEKLALSVRSTSNEKPKKGILKQQEFNRLLEVLENSIKELPTYQEE